MTQIELTKRLIFLEEEAARQQESIDTLEKVVLYVDDKVDVTIHVSRNKQDDPVHLVKAGGLIYLLKKEKSILRMKLRRP